MAKYRITVTADGLKYNIEKNSIFGWHFVHQAASLSGARRVIDRLLHPVVETQEQAQANLTCPDAS